MKHDLTLTATNVLIILLMTLHVADDVVRGFAPGGLSITGGLVVIGLMLYGVVIPEGRTRYVLVLVDRSSAQSCPSFI